MLLAQPCCVHVQCEVFHSKYCWQNCLNRKSKRKKKSVLSLAVAMTSPHNLFQQSKNKVNSRDRAMRGFLVKSVNLTRTFYSFHDKSNKLTNNESVFVDNLWDWLFACRIFLHTSMKPCQWNDVPTLCNDFMWIQGKKKIKRK